VMVGFPDVYGRLIGKRVTLDHFLSTVAGHGTHACSYLLTVDIEMTPLPGFGLANWDRGYGDLCLKPDLTTLRPVPWLDGTAVVLCNLAHPDGRPVAEAPRQVLARALEPLRQAGLTACMGSELEFFLFRDTYDRAAARRFQRLRPASDYLIDYHLLQPSRDEDVLRRIRCEMNAARIPIECSKGEWGRGQHEVNLAYADATEMADRHVLYKTGVKEIAVQQGRAVTFMAKWSATEAGSSFHLHTSLWDQSCRQNLFWDEARGAESRLFRGFLGGLLAYSRELAYFFAPTVNSYKRYQASSWAPTRIVWARDNRTCGLRVVGAGAALRIENRMPGADANPYLAYAATVIAGWRGVEEGLDCGEPFAGNAYLDTKSPRLPASLGEATELLAGSALARQALGAEVHEFYLQNARQETGAYRAAVTDWERARYFEQI